MLKTKSQIYNISSKNAENGSFKSQVRCQLPDLNFTNQNIRNVYLSVLHCEVPNSFYIVNYTNNSIVINSITYTLTKGNYNANTFITMLLSILPTGYSMIYSSITNKYTITHSTSNFTINASNANCKINSVMGLGDDDISSTSLSLELPFVVNFLPLARINFRTNIFNFKNYNQADNSGDIFLSLQNDAPQQAMIFYTNTASTKYLIEDRSITSFLITITNDINQLINFNNIDWYLTFQIDIEFIEAQQTVNFNNIINSNNLNLLK